MNKYFIFGLLLMSFSAYADFAQLDSVPLGCNTCSGFYACRSCGAFSVFNCGYPSCQSAVNTWNKIITYNLTNYDSYCLITIKNNGLFDGCNGYSQGTANLNLFDEYNQLITNISSYNSYDWNCHDYVYQNQISFSLSMFSSMGTECNPSTYNVVSVVTDVINVTWIAGNEITTTTTTTTTTSTPTTSLADNHKETYLVFTELNNNIESPLTNITAFSYYEDGVLMYEYLYGNNYTFYSGVYTNDYDLVNNNSVWIYSTNDFAEAEINAYKTGFKCENGDYSCTIAYSDLINYQSVLVEQYFIYSSIFENDTYSLSGYTLDQNDNIISYVNVKIDNIYSSYNSVSDENGFYNISIIKQGNYRIKGVKEGYDERGEDINIYSNTVHNVSMYLETNKNFINGYIKDCKTTDVISQINAVFENINHTKYFSSSNNNGYYGIYLESGTYKVYTYNSIFPEDIHYNDIPLYSDYTLNLCTFRDVYLNKINFHILKSDNSSYAGPCKIFNVNESYLSTINLVNGLSTSYLKNGIYYMICKYDDYSDYGVKSFTSDYDNQNIYIRLENTIYDSSNDPNEQNPAGNYTQKDFINFANTLWGLLSLLLLLFVFSLFSRI